MQEVELLKNVTLFGTMDAQELANVLAAMKSFVFSPGQTIIRQNDPPDYFYIVTKGSVEVSTTDASGQDLFLEHLDVGAFFGELAMLTGQPRTARCQALDEVHCLGLGREELHTFLMKNPHAAIDLLTVISNRLYNTDKLLKQSVSKSVNEIVSEKQTLGGLLADRFAFMMGSWIFILIQTAILLGWVVYNFVAPKESRFDEYPFIFLNLALSFQAAYAAPIIMMSQNRQAQIDRVAAEVDHGVNVKSEIKTGLVMNRLADLERSMHFMHQQVLGALEKGRRA